MGKCEGPEIIDDLISDLLSCDLERPLMTGKGLSGLSLAGVR